MSTKKNYRKHTAGFKTKVVLEALKERETLSELGHRYQLNPTQIATWKKQFLGGAEQVFGQGPVVDAKAHEQEKAELHQQIGELTVTVNWLKKNCCNDLGTAKGLGGPGYPGVEHCAAVRDAGDPSQRLLLQARADV